MNSYTYITMILIHSAAHTSPSKFKIYMHIHMYAKYIFFTRCLQNHFDKTMLLISREKKSVTIIVLGHIAIKLYYSKNDI